MFGSFQLYFQLDFLRHLIGLWEPRLSHFLPTFPSPGAWMQLPLPAYGSCSPCLGEFMALIFSSHWLIWFSANLPELGPYIHVLIRTHPWLIPSSFYLWSSPIFSNYSGAQSCSFTWTWLQPLKAQSPTSRSHGKECCFLSFLFRRYQYFFFLN